MYPSKRTNVWSFHESECLLTTLVEAAATAERENGSFCIGNDILAAFNSSCNNKDVQSTRSLDNIRDRFKTICASAIKTEVSTLQSEENKRNKEFFTKNSVLSKIAYIKVVTSNKI